ncbi:MAG TPA: 4-hydroxy-2-oxovalerate aldolase [Acidimicrobiales bacterium]|nr:4-hydroxy-2-oxovalerate aldolase [Acidimicrobiales bacterium]
MPARVAAPYSSEIDVRITDSSLRDGSHHVRHRFTVDEVRRIVSALDGAGVPVIEVSHGDGLGGSSFTYGFSAVDERVLVKAAVESAKRAKIACLLLPGVGTREDIEAVADLGASVLRVATHCTEADIAIQHFGLARDLGLETVGFLMMAHSQPPEVLARQARIMADAGCQCVYVTDSAGALVLDEVAERIEALRAELGADATVGFHGHENLDLGVANTIIAISAGASQVDGCTRRFGAGAGNTPTEALVAVCDKLGIRTGVSALAMFDVAEDVVLPVMREEPRLSRLALLMGYAGVYSSFLRHAYDAADRYGVSGAEIILRCGAARLVGGQEDQIIDIAASLAAAQASPAGA